MPLDNFLQNQLLFKICSLISESDNIVIAGHEFPDGDSIGSCFSLGNAIKSMGKKVSVVIDDYDERFSVIPGKELVYHGDLKTLDASLFICVDCSSADRLGRAEIMLQKTPETICIDHHINDAPCGKYNYVNPNASATCELIFNILVTMIEINVDIAAALYAGIVYDTGGFRHPSTTPEALDIAGRLIPLGIPFTNIYNTMMKQRSLQAAKMLGLALSRLKLENGVAYSHVTYSDLQEHNATTDDLDQISGELIATRDAEVSVFVYEKKAGSSKASFRSKSINVCDIAKSFGGGGHEKAAGASLDMPADEALSLMLKRINASIAKTSL